MPSDTQGGLYKRAVHVTDMRVTQLKNCPPIKISILFCQIYIMLQNENIKLYRIRFSAKKDWFTDYSLKSDKIYSL